MLITAVIIVCLLLINTDKSSHVKIYTRSVFICCARQLHNVNVLHDVKFENTDLMRVVNLDSLIR